MDSNGNMQQYQQQPGQESSTGGASGGQSQQQHSAYDNMMQQGGQQGGQQNYYSTYAQGYPQQGGGGGGRAGAQSQQQGYQQNQQQYAAMSQTGAYPQPGQEGEYDSRGYQQQYHGDYGAPSGAGGAEPDDFDLPGVTGAVTVPGGPIGSPISSSRIVASVVAPGDGLPDLSGPPLDAAPISKPSADAYGAPY